MECHPVRIVSRCLGAGVFVALLAACSSNKTSADSSDAQAAPSDAATLATTAGDAALKPVFAPDGGVIACGSVTCDLGAVVTPLATLDVCCPPTGPGGFGSGVACGLNDPPPFGSNACVPLKGPGVLDSTCPDVSRPLQMYKGCCTPQGVCGGYANQLFGFTTNYGCAVENIAKAKPCKAPSAAEAAWHPDPVQEAGACTPKAGACLQECGCQQCPDLTAKCLNDPGCMAIVTCGIQNGCTGAACLTACGSVISQYANSAATASATGDCVSAHCPQCPQGPDAGI